MAKRVDMHVLLKHLQRISILLRLLNILSKKAKLTDIVSMAECKQFGKSKKHKTILISHNHLQVFWTFIFQFGQEVLKFNKKFLNIEMLILSRVYNFYHLHYLNSIQDNTHLIKDLKIDFQMLLFPQTKLSLLRILIYL
ncbi:unnamed protein product [Paramecium sonneborni]|uniref:Uncharacterized protein n=1 Tax=Paramecium sonneborni TaxID=65129 RepID=A0A8S1RU76_9CILI|nr:unnamed protein product [Paramecium sonneborni]